MNKLEKYLKISNNAKVQYWIRHNLKYHLAKNEENQTEIEHIIDYLLSDRSPSRNSLKKLSYEELKKETHDWNKKLIDAAGIITESEEDIEVLINFNNGFKLVQLIGKNAYEREGKLMRHCVSSYYNRDSNVEIYSLRDPQNKPHCTMEIQRENGYINQIKGKGNGSIHPKYIGGVLQSLKYFNMEVNSREMQHLGYEKLSDSYWSFIDSNFSGARYIMFQNEKYFYKYSNLKKK
jgi:hypothetical protein